MVWPWCALASRGDRHLKEEQRTIFDAVARGFLFSGAARTQKKTKGRGGPLRVGIAAFTCPTHGPIPPPTHRRPLPGPLRVGWPLQGPWATPRGPQRPQRGDGRPSPQQQHPAQTTAGRPPEHTMATPNANQTPQGASTSPCSPLVAMGGLWGCQKSKNRPPSHVCAFRPGWVWPGS